jgi:glycosyltransferase involved in cell wall biosynthesis
MTFGGAERQVVHLAGQLLQRGWDVEVVSLLEPDALTDRLAEAGVAYRTLAMPKGVPDPRGAWRLARCIRQMRPDVVHAHMVHANLVTRVTRLLARMPVLICSAHSVFEGGKRFDLAYRLTDGLCELTTHVSQAAVDRWVRGGVAPARKMRVMPNGVDVAQFGGGAEGPASSEKRRDIRTSLGIGGEFTFLAVGRFKPAKDYGLMLEAFARLRERRESAGRLPVRLLIAGGGALLEEMRSVARVSGLEEAVSFLGKRADIPDLMQAADAYVMSSAWEGMPVVLLEAAASGLPIVATDVGGNREVLRSDEIGYLVPPGDPAALADALGRLVELPEERRRAMGRAARELVESEYSLERVVSDWEAVYRELMESASRGAAARGS